MCRGARGMPERFPRLVCIRRLLHRKACALLAEGLQATGPQSTAANEQWSGCGQLEDRRGVICHQLDVEPLEGADPDFIGREVNVPRDLHIEPGALTEIP